jgi:hypothetical protein
MTAACQSKIPMPETAEWDWSATGLARALAGVAPSGFEKQRPGIDAAGPQAGFALLGAGWRQVQ